MPGKHLHSLDGLRGLAALVVVFAHWIHFHYGAEGTVRPDPALLPMSGNLWYLYKYGYWAVNLFFALSGFIFFWLYADRVADRGISAGTFFWLRISRLYPLHLVTLVAVAAGQAGWYAWRGHYFVYRSNDLEHFALQLALASNWTGKGDWSFNAPIWSVSVEVLLYAAFFTLFFLRLRRWWWPAAVCVAAVVAVPNDRPLLAEPFAAFFAGGVAYRVYAAATPGRWLLPVTAALVAVWGVVLWAVTTGAVVEWYRGLAAPLVAGDRDVGLVLAAKVSRFAPYVLLFPAAVAVVAWWDARLPGSRRWLERLGQISYSSYLLHFPLQMAFAAATDAAGVSRDFYRTPVSMLAFFAVLIPLSFACFHYVERPAQRWLRRMGPGRRGPQEATADRAAGSALPVRRPVR